MCGKTIKKSLGLSWKCKYLILDWCALTICAKAFTLSHFYKVQVDEENELYVLLLHNAVYSWMVSTTLASAGPWCEGCGDSGS